MDKGKVWFEGGSRGGVIEYFNLVRFFREGDVGVWGEVDELGLKRSFFRMKAADDKLGEWFEKFELKFIA